MNQHELLKELVAVRIKRALARTKQQYERNFYNQVGRGVTPQEYNAVLDKLVKEGFVTRGTTERGASVLNWVEQSE